MNSCLTCLFYGNSSLQIWGPGRKHVWELVQSKSCIPRILTSQLKKQGLDKLLINKRNSGWFTIVNLAFILPPLPTQQTRRAFTIVKWEKLVTLKKTETMVNFTYYSKKKPKCDLSQWGWMTFCRRGPAEMTEGCLAFLFE